MIRWRGEVGCGSCALSSPGTPHPTTPDFLATSATHNGECLRLGEKIIGWAQKKTLGHHCLHPEDFRHGPSSSVHSLKCRVIEFATARTVAERRLGK